MSETDNTQAPSEQDKPLMPKRRQESIETIVSYLRRGRHTMALGPLAELTRWMSEGGEILGQDTDSGERLIVCGYDVMSLPKELQWELAHLFSLVAVAKARGDWIRIADLLQYEINPRLQKAEKVIEDDEDAADDAATAG